MKDDQFIKHMDAMNRIADDLRDMRLLLAMLKRAGDVTLEPRDFDDRPADYDEDHPEDPTPAAVDPDHTFVKLGDEAEAVVRTSMQRACEGAGWTLIDDTEGVYVFLHEGGEGYSIGTDDERAAWAGLYDNIQREQGVVPHTGRVVADDAHLLRVAKALAAVHHAPWGSCNSARREYFANLARVAIESYEAFK